MSNERPTMNTQPISVSFNVSDNYVQHLAVVVVSILTNAPNSRFVFHVLTREMSEESRLRLRKIEQEYGRCRFEIHVVDFSVIGAIPPLWSVALGDKMLGGVIDNFDPDQDLMDYRAERGLSPGSKYVNSGVLVMDLEKLRRFDFPSKCFATIDRLRDILSFVDQDTINIVAEGHIQILPERWNCQNRPRTLDGERPVIRHFTSFTNKPWCNIWKNRTWPLYLRYLLKSPYRDRAVAFVLGHLKGFFWYRFVKKGIERTILLGLTIRKRPAPKK